MRACWGAVVVVVGLPAGTVVDTNIVDLRDRIRFKNGTSTMTTTATMPLQVVRILSDIPASKSRLHLNSETTGLEPIGANTIPASRPLPHEDPRVKRPPPPPLPTITTRPLHSSSTLIPLFTRPTRRRPPMGSTLPFPPAHPRPLISLTTHLDAQRPVSWAAVALLPLRRHPTTPMRSNHNPPR